MGTRRVLFPFSGQYQNRVTSGNKVLYRKLYDLLDSGTTVIHQTYEREIPASLGCRFVRLLKQDLYSFRRQMLYYRLMFLLYRNGKYLLVVIQGFR